MKRRWRAFVPPKGVFSHIVGIDLVRTGPDDFFVLEDNCRTPSGVSYMLENREIMMRMFPELFRENRIEPVDSYPDCCAARWPVWPRRNATASPPS
jgi:uncharacterized circularly permuted ATP-grasp superfamily protein